MQGDGFTMNMGLSQMTVIPQLLFQAHYGSMLSDAIKIGDNLLLTGDAPFDEPFLGRFDSSFKLGTFVRGPGTLTF